MNLITVTIVRMTRFLFGIGLFLFLTSVAYAVAKFTSERGLPDFTSFLDADAGTNVFVWFSSALLLACSVLLGIISLEASKTDSHLLHYWQGLFVTFLCLSLNKTVGFHRRVMGVLKDGSAPGHDLYSAWLTAASLGAVLLSLACLKFLRQLPPRIARLFILAGATFVVSVLGLPHLLQLLAQSYSRDHIVFSLSITLKQSLEMVGTILFLHALLLYLASRNFELEVAVI